MTKGTPPGRASGWVTRALSPPASCCAVVWVVRRKYVPPRSVEMHTIAFGGDADVARLQSMASTCRGTFHQSTDGVQLLQTFVSIAAGCAQARLVERFGERLALEVNQRIALDYL